MKTGLRTFAGSLTLLMASPALAQEDAPGAFDVSGTATVTSDYRFRGISYSDKEPAVQGSLDIAHQSGLYAGVWASSIAEYVGTHVETDIYGGWRGSAGGLDFDIGAVAYLYPGRNGGGGNYAELTGSVSHTLGPVEATLGATYAPSQKNIGNADNLYLFTKLASGIPGTPLSLAASIGHEDGSLAGPTGKKWDWSLGVDYVRGPITLGVAYVDSDISKQDDPARTAQGRIVASLSLAF